MRQNIQNESEHQQILDYIQSRIDSKKRAEGRIVSDTDRVYVLYVRKSTKGKDKNGKKRQEKSIDDQISECRKNIISKMENKPLQIFRVDPKSSTTSTEYSREKIDGVSVFREEQSAKKSGKRDEFRAMMNGIKDGKYNSIIAYHPDRLARNMKEAGEIMDFLDQGLIADLQFATYTFNNDENGKLALGIQFALAKYYSDHLSTSSSRGSHGLAREGKVPNNKPKFGYKLVGRYNRPDGNSFLILKEAFQMALTRISQSKIAEYLNENHFSYMTRSTKMTKQKLSDIFADTFYAGTYQYGEEVIDLTNIDPKYVPMITETEFLRLRDIMSKSKPIEKKEQSVVLLRKMVYCGHCNQIVSPTLPTSEGKNKMKYLSFYCHRKNCLSKEKELGNKSGFRGKVIFNFIRTLLKNGIHVDPEGYEVFKEETLSEVALQKENLKRRLGQLPLDRKRSEVAIKTLSTALDKATSAKVEKRLDKDIGRELELQHSLRQEALDLDSSIRNLENQLATYDQFCNTFKYLPDIIGSNDDQYLVDKLTLLLFSKFVVKNDEVISYELNPKYMITINRK